VKRQLIGMVRKEIGDVCDVDTHFTPAYNPWDQRLCLVPNGDCSRRSATARRRWSPTRSTASRAGVRLTSGEVLDADMSSPRRGCKLVTLGEVDRGRREPIDFASTWTYKGFAYSDVPNLASTFGLHQRLIGRCAPT